MESSNTILPQLASRDDLHMARKIWHLTAGGAALSLYFYSNLSVQQIIIIAFAIAAVALVVDLLRLRVAKFNRWYVANMGIILRKSEVKGFSGLPFFASGCGLSLLLFPEELAVLSIIFLVFADPIASYVGIRYGTQKISHNKSLEGSLAAFITCFVCALFYGLHFQEKSLNFIVFCILAGVVGSLSEMASEWIDDNFSIPVLSGLGLTGLNALFQVF